MRILIFIVIPIIFFIQSCGSNRSDLDNFFTEVDKSLTEKEKMELINCESIDCIMGFAFKSRNKKFKEVFIRMDSTIINSVDVFELPYYRYFCLVIAYHRDRNGIDYDFEELYQEIIAYDIREREAMDKWFDNEVKKQTLIAKTQFNRIQPMDVVDLFFPINYLREKCEILFRPQHDDEELIKIVCKVIEKRLIPATSEEGEDDYYELSLEVIDLSHTGCGFNEVIDIGSHINLDLFEYARVGPLESR